jgi:hypothetical protein
LGESPQLAGAWGLAPVQQPRFCSQFRGTLNAYDSTFGAIINKIPAKWLFSRAEAGFEPK